MYILVLIAASFGTFLLNLLLVRYLIKSKTEIAAIKPEQPEVISFSLAQPAAASVRDTEILIFDNPGKQIP